MTEMAPLLAERGLQALDADQPKLEDVRWAIYDANGSGNGWDQTGRYDFINTYLRSPFRSEYTYGGACARFITTATPQYLSGSWSWKYGDSAGSTPQAAKQSWFGSIGTTAVSGTGGAPPSPPSSAQLGGTGKVTSVATAKPFGTFNQSTPQSAGLVLPVFSEVRLIPVSLASSSKFSEDPGFYRFLVDYFGNLNYPNVPDDIKNKYAGYLQAIQIYNDQTSLFNQGWWQYDTWRANYMTGGAKDPCTPVFPPGGSGGSRGGPDVIH